MNTLLESTKSSPRKSKTFRAAFIPTQVSGVSYYRMCNFAWEMRKWPNTETVVFPYSSSHLIENPWQRDFLTYPEVREKLENVISAADIVVWQPVHYPHSLDFFEEMRLKYQKPFLLELDDYISDIPAGNEAFNAYSPNSVHYKVAMAQIRASDALIVSTPYLAKLYANDHKSIHVMPNSIDLKEWEGLGGKKHGRFRIGWIGGGTHGADLEMVAPAIKDILDKYDDVWFYCIHGCPDIFKRWKKVFHTTKWAPINLYPKFMASYRFDVGIAPLVDNNFNRGKSNLRWLEYSALGIPTIASPLPDFTRVIKSGTNGFIADSLDDWRQHLMALIELPALRKDVGAKAMQTVKSDFNVRKTAKRYLDLLRSLF